MVDDKPIEKLPENILDDFLFDGYNVCRKMFDEYNLVSKTEGFDANKYKQNYGDALDKWYCDVQSYMYQSLPEKHLVFHFLEPKDNLSLSFHHPIGQLRHEWMKRLHTLEEVILWLKEQTSLKTRLAIAELEHDADVLYRVTYVEHNHKIKVNDIVLAHPDFNSENDNFFAYVIANPNRPIGLKELEQHNGGAFQKDLSHIVTGCGFVGNLREIFFPDVQKSQVTFKNPISKQYFYKNNLKPLNFGELSRLEKIQEGGGKDKKIADG